MNNHHFQSAEIENIGNIFLDALLASLSNLDNELREKIVEFWQAHLRTSKPFKMVTEAGMVKTAKTIFGDEDLGSFMLQLTSNFYLMWGASHSIRTEFVKTVAASVCQNNGIVNQKSSSYEAIPNDVQGRMASYSDVEALLLANGWLLMLVIAPTFMSHKDMELKQPKGRGGVQ